MPNSIFLSYSSKDKDFARRLAAELREVGVNVWVDQGEIKLGDSLIDKIEAGIEHADYLGVVLSPSSVQSEWVKREVEIALYKEIAGKKVIVLPLLYQECKIPAFLSGKLYADFRTTEGHKAAFDLILNRLGQLNEGETSAVASAAHTGRASIPSANRYSCSPALYRDTLTSLLWCDQLIVPYLLIASGGWWSGFDRPIINDLFARSLITSEVDLHLDGTLAGDEVFNPAHSDAAAIDFAKLLSGGGVSAPPIYESEPQFTIEFGTGHNRCLSIVLKNFPRIEPKHISVLDFVAFIQDDETVKLRRRLFNWMNEVDRRGLRPREVQELIATHLDDYTSWIKAAKLKHSAGIVESVLLHSSEFIDNLLNIKLSQSVSKICEFRKRDMAFVLDELHAPGRELALIHHTKAQFGEQS